MRDQQPACGDVGPTICNKIIVVLCGRGKGKREQDKPNADRGGINVCRRMKK
jgi:hypothetical protein